MEREILAKSRGLVRASDRPPLPDLNAPVKQLISRQCAPPYGYDHERRHLHSGTAGQDTARDNSVAPR